MIRGLPPSVPVPLSLEAPENLQLGEQDRLLETGGGRQALSCGEHRELPSASGEDPLAVDLSPLHLSPLHMEMRYPPLRPDMGAGKPARTDG